MKLTHTLIATVLMMLAISTSASSSESSVRFFGVISHPPCELKIDQKGIIKPNINDYCIAFNKVTIQELNVTSSNFNRNIKTIKHVHYY